MRIGVENSAKDLGRLEYLLGDKEANGSARPVAPIASGSPQLLLDCNTCNRYSNLQFEFTCSWGEDLSTVPAADIDFAAKTVTRMFIGPLPLADFAEVEVRHFPRSSGGFDLHHLFSSLHLPSGREFPFFTNKTSHWRLIRAATSYLNARFGWSNPYDPIYQLLITRAPKNLPAEDKSAFRELDRKVTSWIKSGRINSREDLVADLNREGIEAETTVRAITCRYKGKDLTFEGGKYKMGFCYSRYAPGPNRRRAHHTQSEQLRETYRTLQSERDRELKSFADRKSTFPITHWPFPECSYDEPRESPKQSRDQPPDGRDRDSHEVFPRRVHVCNRGHGAAARDASSSGSSDSEAAETRSTNASELGRVHPAEPPPTSAPSTGESLSGSERKGVRGGSRSPALLGSHGAQAHSGAQTDRKITKQHGIERRIDRALRSVGAAVSKVERAVGEMHGTLTIQREGTLGDSAVAGEVSDTRTAGASRSGISLRVEELEHNAAFFAAGVRSLGSAVSQAIDEPEEPQLSALPLPRPKSIKPAEPSR